MLKITTQNGSVYMVDLTTNEWVRQQTAPASGHIRTEGGIAIAIEPPSIGFGLLIVAEPINPEATHRIIYTSDITAIEDAPTAHS